MSPNHPVLACVETIDQALKDAAGVAVEFLAPGERREALLRVTELAGRLESLRLRLIAASRDVATDEGCRDVATWLARHSRTDRHTEARSERLARALDRSWPHVADALAHGSVNPAQAHAVASALDALPTDLPTEVRDRAESHLVDQAATFTPRELRVLGRRVLDIIAPEVGEAHEHRMLLAEERAARRATTLTTTRLGDGTTLIRARVPEATAQRLDTYLSAFASPRRGVPGPDDETLTHPQRLGHAFCALLETLDPSTLPRHGGDATTVLVTVDLATLRDGLGTALLGPDTLITAGHARRLACTASLIPAVLGTESEPLDLGRTSRLFTPTQRRAMALRDRTCRALGCDIPAPWCEAHHAADPWAHDGRTDLADGLLLCSWHHHRAHDDRYLHTRLPNGDVRFHRRT